MALEGSLTDFGLADILQLIYFQRKTGILSLSSRIDKVKLIFIDGNITGAESKRRIDDNRLGKILLKKGVFKEADLQSVLEEQRKTHAKIGNILIKRGLATREAVFEILNNQVTETVTQLFSWKQGTYEFNAQGIPPDKEFPFSLDTQHLLMEGLRIVDEWSVIKGKIALDTLFQKKSDDTSQMSDDEKELFGYVDGENDVSTIIDLSGRDNFEASKILLALLEKGAIETIEPVIVTSPEEAAAEMRSGGSLLNYAAPAAIALSLVLSFVMVLFTYSGLFSRNYRSSVLIEDLRYRIEAYKIEHAAYPETLAPVAPGVDPWGRPFLYRVNEAGFILLSAGADGKEGTNDDIY
ncbi:MAG: DUF4388 domain-containing protein [Thermodesulfovibrionales bacterium]